MPLRRHMNTLTKIRGFIFAPGLLWLSPAAPAEIDGNDKEHRLRIEQRWDTYISFRSLSLSSAVVRNVRSAVRRHRWAKLAQSVSIWKALCEQSRGWIASRSSPSRVKGIKRENFVNLSPSINFETVAEGKKHWPLYIRDLWRDRISSLVHETKVVPPQLKVSRFRDS
jgi:hypothetical protein